MSGQWFSWTLSNGSVLSFDQNPGYYSRACEPGAAKDFLVTAVPKGRPDQVSYVASDVQVFQGAAGVPWGQNGLDDIFGTVSDSSLLWASRCLPTLSKNPVRCSQGGQVSIGSGILSVINGDCTVSTQSLQLNPAIFPAAVLGACTQNHTLGTATILLGGTNGNPNATEYGVPNGASNGYGDYLKLALYDSISDDTSTFAVTCEVDIGSAVQLQLLNYSRSDNLGKRELVGWSQIVVNTGYGYQVRVIPDSNCTISDDASNPLAMNDILSSRNRWRRNVAAISRKHAL